MIYNQPSLFRQRGQGLSIDIRNDMQSVRHRHSGVNRGGVASRHSNRSFVRKSCEKFKRQGERKGIVLENIDGGN